jgi:hypothetical protein
LLVVASQPLGAQVEIDGQPVDEPTPAAVRGLPAGLHVVHIRLDGHAPVEQVVTLAAAERMEIDPVLPPAHHAVEVQTVPSGALVYLDGHLQAAETPLTVQVDDDDFHQLRIEKTGYEIATRALTPEDPAPSVTLTLEPERQPHGTLWVESNRAAQVFIDGRDTGLTTPTLGIRVGLGEHVVQLRDARGRSGASVRVRVARGENHHFTLDSDAELR